MLKYFFVSIIFACCTRFTSQYLLELDYAHSNDTPEKLVNAHMFDLYSSDASHVLNFEGVASKYTKNISDVLSSRFRSYPPGGIDHNGACPPFESCLVYTFPIQKDRSCLVSLPQRHQTQKEYFTGPFDSEISIEEFVAGKIGFSLQTLALFNHTTAHYAVPQRKNMKCDEVNFDEISPKQFLSKYWLPQRPVVIKNFFVPMPRSQLDIELRNHGDVRVGAKLSPSVEFEGIDDLLNWEMARSQHVPREVLNQMESPHLVVVRAAHEEMALRDVLGIMQDSHDVHLDNWQRKKEKRLLSCDEVGNDEPDVILNGSSCPSSAGIMRDSDEYTVEGSSNVYVEYMPIKDESLLQLFRSITNLSQLSGESGSGNMYNDNNGSLIEKAFKEEFSRKNQDPIVEILGDHAEFVNFFQEGNGYIWIGDGRAVGKMHFDPFDNILLQVEGSKRFRLIDPSDNTRLYEGHMREAELEAKLEKIQHDDIAPKKRDAKQEDGIKGQRRYKFRKRKLTESTSMVHSPVDMDELHTDMHYSVPSEHTGGQSKDNAKKKKRHNDAYPKSKGVPMMDCTVNKGDAIWVPSFWWHEVKSYPQEIGKDTEDTNKNTVMNTKKAPDHQRQNHKREELFSSSSNFSSLDSRHPLNIAVNVWFAPLYEKEFPCATCKKSKLNQKYAKVLQELIRRQLLA